MQNTEWDRGRPRPHVPNGRLRHMLIGYARVSKTDGSRSLDLQRDGPAGRGHRRGQRLPRLRLRRTRRPAGTRQLLASPAEGRRARRLEARPPGPQPRPSGQHRAGPVRPRRGPCGCSPARARRSTPRPRPAGGLVDASTAPTTAPAPSPGRRAGVLQSAGGGWVRDLVTI